MAASAIAMADMKWTCRGFDAGELRQENAV